MYYRVALLASIGLAVVLIASSCETPWDRRYPPADADKKRPAAEENVRPVRAEVVRSIPANRMGAGFVIEVDEKAEGPSIRIPATLVANLPQQQLDEMAARNSSRPRNGLVFAGLALALSFTFGGLWLQRRARRASACLSGLLLAVATFMAIDTNLRADVPDLDGRYHPRPFPLPPIFPVDPPPALNPVAYEGKADVVYVDGGEPVRLVLDKATYEKLKKGELKAVKEEQK